MFGFAALPQSVISQIKLIQRTKCGTKTRKFKANNIDVLSNYYIVPECEPVSSISGPHSLYRYTEPHSLFPSPFMSSSGIGHQNSVFIASVSIHSDVRCLSSPNNRPNTWHVQITNFYGTLPTSSCNLSIYLPENLIGIPVIWTLKNYVIWSRVDWYVIIDVLEKLSVPIFRVFVVLR